MVTNVKEGRQPALYVQSGGRTYDLHVQSLKPTRLAQSIELLTLDVKVVASSPTLCMEGGLFIFLYIIIFFNCSCFTVIDSVVDREAIPSAEGYVFESPA